MKNRILHSISSKINSLLIIGFVFISSWVFAQSPQTITFDPLSPATYGDADITLGATASSGLAVTYTTDDPNIAKVNGNQLEIISAGTVIIYADQAGDVNYLPAPQAQQTLIIDKKDLVVSGLTVIDKIYDANTSASLSGTATISPIVTDDVLIGGTAVGVFADKNVGPNKLITVSGVTISGSDAINYNLIQQSGLTANILVKDLSVSGLTASDKIYDATATATLGGTATVTPLGTDDVIIGGTAVGVYADKNVEPNKPITVSGVTISGTDASNYNLIQQSGLKANITEADLTVSGLTTSDKVYDASTNATLGGTATVTPLGTDDVTIGGTAVGVYADKNVGLNKPITVSGVTISGIDASNYNLIQQSGLKANITLKDLTVSGLTASNKVYDATAAATLGGTPTITPLGTDNVIIGGTAVGAYTDKNVGTNKPITVSGVAISGTDASNYSLIQQNDLKANITQKELTIGGTFAANDKVYDATVTATIKTNNLTLNTIETGDDVTLTPIATFATKTADTAKVISLTGCTLSGADAANYTISLVNAPTAKAKITKANLTIGGTFTANNKAYDGTTSATIATNNLVLNTVLGSDDVALNAVAIFATKTVGTAKVVNLTGTTLSGTDASNYTLSLTGAPTSSADITGIQLTVTGAVAQNKIYDGNNSAQIKGATLVGVMGNDDVKLVNHNSGLFAQREIGNDIAVSTLPMAITGADAGNYTLVQPTGLKANIYSTIGIEENKANSEGVITAYPNPSNGVINFKISLNNAAKISIDIISMNGAMVSRVFEGEITNVDSQVITVDQRLPQGMYFYKMNVENKVLVGKIIVN